MSYRFVFDAEKSMRNLIKHGIDFQQAQGIWSDGDRVEVRALSDTENRWIVTGLIGDKHWTAIITYRAEFVRVISVRRARREEIERYES